MILFEVKDRTGRVIFVTLKAWKHILAEHPEVSLNDIVHVISSPDIITQDEEKENFYFYYKHSKRKAKYLIVLIKYINDKGTVITSYYSPKIYGLK